MAFPTTPVLDDCARADENPLSHGGVWTNGFWGFANAKLLTNLLTSTSSFGGAHITTALTGADCEVYGTIGEDTNDHYLFARVINPTTTPRNGYLIDVRGVTNALVVKRRDSGVDTQIAFWSTPLAAGDVCGMTIIGSTITGYVNGGAISSVVDATYPAAGYIGFAVFAATSTFSSFGGGVIASSDIHARSLLGVGT